MALIVIQNADFEITNIPEDAFAEASASVRWLFAQTQIDPLIPENSRYHADFLPSGRRRWSVTNSKAPSMSDPDVMPIPICSGFC